MFANYMTSYLGTTTKIVDPRTNKITAIDTVSLPKTLNTDPSCYGNLATPLDLNINWESFRKHGGREKLDTVLLYIEEMAKHQGNERNLKKVAGCDFVSTRKLLATIAASPKVEKTFQFLAVRHKNVIFMSKVEDDAEPEPCPANQYNYKFKQYMTLGLNGNPVDPETPVSNLDQKKAVMKTICNKGGRIINLMYSAEVDAKDIDDTVVEITTIRYKPGDSKPPRNWILYKSLKVYLKCFLSHTQNIVVGYRNEDGVVECVEKWLVSDIPKFRGIKWEEQECKLKMYDVMQQLQFELQENGMAKLYEFTGRTFRSIHVNPEMCDFVSQEFLSKFD